jgi:hypothetical protein
MSFAGLLNQTITIKPPAASVDDYGRPSFGAGVVTLCRFEKLNKTKLLPNGQSIIIDGRVFIPGDVAAQINSHVEFGADLYKVISVSEMVDGRGATRHKELELQSWVA